MSIATDEAEKVYPRSAPLAATSDNNICRRTAYIAGRTAEPTEVEIWIIARALYEHLAVEDFGHEVSDDEWEKYKSYDRKNPMQCPEYMKAKGALEAARKAVMGGE